MAAKKEEKAVAKISKQAIAKIAPLSDENARGYMVLADPASSQELTVAMKENIGDGMISITDLDRVRIPNGGALNFVVPGEETEEGPRKVTGIIIGWKDNRAYWKEPFGSGPNVPPDCTSDDGHTGIGNPGGDCAVCPFAQFGSGQGGRRQACKAMRTVFIIEPGAILPIVLSAPPTSLKNMRQYFLRTAGQGAPYYGVVTEFSLSKKTNAGGLVYSQVQLQAVGKLSSEATKQMKAYSDAMKPALSRAARALTQEAAAETLAKEALPDDEPYGGTDEEGDPQND